MVKKNPWWLSNIDGDIMLLSIYYGGPNRILDVWLMRHFSLHIRRSIAAE